jgi:DNA-binding beta-propeller fold protein YncE
MKNVIILGALASFAAAAPAQQPSFTQDAGGAAARATYHVARKLTIGGDGGWDYLTVDTANHRLYVSRGTHVMVIDTDKEAVVGDIPNTLGVHGIAIALDLGRGFTSNGRDTSVTIFDLKTYAVISVVKGTGINPDAILYEPVTKRVFTMNGRSNNATAIDATTGKIVGTVPLTGKPEFAQHDGLGHVFVNVEDKAEIIMFDAATLAAQSPWPMAGCEEPSGLAIDRAHGLLYAGCGNKVMAVVDAKAGKEVATVPIGQGVDATAYDAGTQTAFSSNGEGTLTVIRAAPSGGMYSVKNVPTQRGARTMALDERTHLVYTVTADFGPAPAATAENPRPRPPMVPGSFVVLVLEP